MWRPRPTPRHLLSLVALVGVIFGVITRLPAWVERRRSGFAANGVGHALLYGELIISGPALDGRRLEYHDAMRRKYYWMSQRP